MQHEPDLVGLVQTHFDEMIARTQGSQMVDVVGVFSQQLRILVREDIQPRLEVLPHFRLQIRNLVPGAAVPPPAMMGSAVRNGLFDIGANLFQVLR